ncbi:hypothetical protein [Pseudophaeobacter arcticus]|jgi:hypothetical protein|uniref:hypothetical protein n=1 Tax=Pseudophaeobacter arcticus TaxID=385492 RepID=UPI0039E53AAD
MTNLPEDASWEAGIYQIEQTDPVLGGPPNLATGAGIANVQAEQLAKRTAWLKQEIATLLATQISTWNGITGGGTLDGGLTLTADLADWGEAQAGTSASKVMSALRVKQVVDAAIDALVGAAPAQMDTLNELAAAITENGDTSSALTALIASKLDAATYTPQDILAKLLGVDGTGSGLDADKLDGLQATSFFRADQSGALTNLGGSKQIFQGWAGDGSRWFLAPRKSDDSNWDWDFEFGFSRQNDWWYCDTDIIIKGYKAWHAGNHGAGSGLNADLLDGDHAAVFARKGWDYTSPATALSLGASTFLHGLGAAPTKLEFDLVCTVDNNGYVVGDRIVGVSSSVMTASGRGLLSFVPTGSTSSVKVVIGSALRFVNTSGGEADLPFTSWQFILKASL